MKKETKNEYKELREDFETYLWKILKFFNGFAIVALVFAAIAYLFYLFDNPIEGYNSESGMLTVISFCISVMLLKVILKKVWFNKPWHE